MCRWNSGARHPAQKGKHVKVEKEYLIRQAPAKALLAFSTPMIIGNLFQQLYTMTDSVIVGQAVGESALAAVGASYALTNVFISIAIGGGVGASVLTSQALSPRRCSHFWP